MQEAGVTGPFDPVPPFAQTCWGVGVGTEKSQWEISEWVCQAEGLPVTLGMGSRHSFLLFFSFVSATGRCWVQRPPRAPGNSRSTGQEAFISTVCIHSAHLTGCSKFEKWCKIRKPTFEA